MKQKKTKTQKGFVKVWQPRGFDGLELYLCENANISMQRLFLSAYYISFGMSQSAHVHYAGVLEDTLCAPVFQSSNPGIYLTSNPARQTYSFRSLVISVPLMEKLTRQIFDKDAILHFNHLLAVHSPARKLLNQLVYQTVESFHQGASQLEKETNLLKSVSRVLHFQARKPLRNGSNVSEHEAIKRTKDYLLEHAAREVKLETLATVSRLHPHYLIETFKKRVGVSPHQFQLQVRIHRATKLLRQRQSTAQLAYDLGFADQAHFSRTFKRFVGVTPGQYLHFNNT
jgi:AraC-like DNA-binding protein